MSDAVVIVPNKIRSSRVDIVVTRANGEVENRGVWSYYNRNPLLHYPVNAWIKCKAWYYKVKEGRDGRTGPK